MQERGRLFITRDAAAVLLITVMWCRAVGTQIVLSLTAKKVFVPIGKDPIWNPAASLTHRALFLLAVGISLGIVLFRMNEVTRPGLWRILVVLAPWLVILTRALYSGSLTPDSLFYPVVVLALAALRPSPRVLIALGALVALTATIAIGFGFLMPEVGIMHDSNGTVSARSDKVVFSSLGLLQGMFTSENNLGQYLAIGAAAVALLPRLWLRLSSLGIVVFAICWSSSRNSMLAIACMLAVGIVVSALVGVGWHRAASAVARIAACAAIVLMCVLPLMRWGRSIHRPRSHLEELSGGVVPTSVSFRSRPRLVQAHRRKRHIPTGSCGLSRSQPVRTVSCHRRGGTGVRCRWVASCADVRNHGTHQPLPNDRCNVGHRDWG